MKSIFALVLIASTTVMAQEVRVLQASYKKYETYSVYESGVKKAVVSVDYKKVAVDCHGLNYSYEVKNLKNGKFLVTKQALMHTMNMCLPHTAITLVQDGIQFSLPVDKNGTIAGEIIAPEGVSVELELTK